MSTSTTNQWKLGLFVFASFFFLVAIAAWIGSRRFKSETLTVYVYFDEPVTGLDVGSPMRFRGMTIGSIAEVRAAPDRHHLEVACTIDVAKLEQIGLREPGEDAGVGTQALSALRAQIERSFVTGVAFLQTDFFDPVRHPIPEYPFEVPEATVHSVPSSQISLQRGLDAMLVQLPELLEQASSTLATIESQVAEAALPTIANELRESLDELQAALREVQWSELDTELRTTLDDLQATLTSARRVLDDERVPLHELMTQATATIERVDSELLRADLPGTTSALRDLLVGYGELAPEARDLLPTLKRAAESFRRLADLLERDPSSLVRGRATPTDPRNGR